MILGTHNSENEPNYLMLAQVQLPLEDAENDARHHEDNRADFGGFGCANGKVWCVDLAVCAIIENFGVLRFGLSRAEDDFGYGYLRVQAKLPYALPGPALARCDALQGRSGRYQWDWVVNLMTVGKRGEMIFGNSHLPLEDVEDGRVELGGLGCANGMLVGMGLDWELVASGSEFGVRIGKEKLG
ncbi:transducin/WD40 repeat-like superfamily protein [Actinidia rufa]|uniref:Transducin/WD40 repeat-like superfamily protein n=1 Tax=Actinidia rufa TaxID=165716 RepID=A0A7J0ES60_9ERIC|nr:transducin/WD40 repeat-like superfamily protein [Actinidia rufa]